MRVFIWAALLATARAQTLHEGFTDSLVANISAPTAIAFLPDDSILVTTQPGNVHIVRNGQRLPDPALEISPSSICSNSERGLLGIAVDPEFSENRYVYLYYTYRLPGRDCSTFSVTNPVNRVSRFVMDESARHIVWSSQTVLLDNIPSFGGNHNAGDLKFGRDGFLLVSVGDGGCYYAVTDRCVPNLAPQEAHTLLGKILRIDPNGNIPPDNNGHATGVRCNHGNVVPGQTCLEIYASGLRNPFRIAVNSATGDVMINDVGEALWEEIDLLVPGANYGWRNREGFCAYNSTSDCSTGELFGSFRNPLYAYRHTILVPGTQSSGCNSLTGGTFIPDNTWNLSWEGYYFADVVCGAIFQLRQEGTGTRSVRELGRDLGGVVALATGPFGKMTAMYYTTYSRGGELRRIVGLVPTSAASYQRTILAPDSLASLFGVGLQNATLAVTDSAGVTRTARLLYTSEAQVNFLVPADLSFGNATLVITRQDGTTLTTQAVLQATRPAVFTANQDGVGVAAATAIRTSGSTRIPIPVFSCSTGGKCIAFPIDVTQGDVYLTLYGTGIRGSGNIQVSVDGIPLQVQHTALQFPFHGVDQLNVLLPTSLAGSGEIPIVVSADGESPPVVVHIQ